MDDPAGIPKATEGVGAEAVATKIVKAVPAPVLALVRIKSRNPVLVLGTE
jgi:hypothetical protein